MRRILRGLAIIALFALHGLPAVAVMPDEVLSDPVLEARAREISKELRCLVCQNQSIDDSNADLARDLRIIVRQRLTAGDSNDQVMQYVVDRYGDYVLLNPPVKGITYALWFGPPAILLLAGGALFLAARRRQANPPAEALSAEERERLAKLLDGDSA